MARTPEYFIDPTNGNTYQWDINHNAEDSTGKKRTIGHSAPTGKIGLNRQQGDSSPLTLKWKGSILKQSQLTQFIAWWQLCEFHSIHVQDFEGNRYEVIITDFQPTRIRLALNRRDLVNMPFHKYEYTLEMEVLSIVSGVWAGVSP